MRGCIVSALCLILGCSAAFSQEGNPRFEVATVKLAAPQSTNAIPRATGGPGTANPGRYTYNNVTLKALLLEACGVANYQISGASFLDSTRVDILAKVPPGATKEQLNMMLQNLLVERFNLTFHHEGKEMAVYELMTGKNGPRLKEAEPNVPPPVRVPGSLPVRIVADKDGFLLLPLGRPMMQGRITDGIMHWTGRMQSLSDLASLLGSELDRPVIDKTGLNGKYDFNLAYSMEGLRPRLRRDPAAPADDTPSGGPSLFKAVQDQLGLKLESAKDLIDILVVDHIDKVPTDN